MSNLRVTIHEMWSIPDHEPFSFVCHEVDHGPYGVTFKNGTQELFLSREEIGLVLYEMTDEPTNDLRDVTPAVLFPGRMARRHARLKTRTVRLKVRKKK